MTGQPTNAELALSLGQHADAGTAAIVHSLLAIADAITGRAREAHFVDKAGVRVAPTNRERNPS